MTIPALPAVIRLCFPFSFSFLRPRRASGVLLGSGLLLAQFALAAPAPPPVRLAPATQSIAVPPASAAASQVAAAQANAVPSATRYVFLLEGGREVGEQTVERAADGAIKTHYALKLGGLGTEFDEQIQLAGDGTVSQYRASGSGPFGAKINESFSQAGAQLKWQAGSVSGAKPVAGTALYVPVVNSPEMASLAVAAMLKRPGGKLALLPAGSLAQRKIDEQVASRSGSTQRVQLVVQTGLGFAPQFYWATVGLQPRLFAKIVPGAMTIIEDGWQANERLLAARQKTAEARLLGDLATHTQHPLNGLTVIRNARVFDSEKAVLGNPSDVYVLRGRIAAVLPAGSAAQGIDGEIDAGGRVLLPGLYDLHAHLARWDGGLFVAAGVTSVRDVGNDNEQLQQMIDETQAGKLLAPQVIPSGLLAGEGPDGAAGGIGVRDGAGVRSALDWYVQHGYADVTLDAALGAPLQAEAASLARARGLRAGGRAAPALRLQDAQAQGMAEVGPVSEVALDALAAPAQPRERMLLVADKVGSIDLNGKAGQDAIAQLKQRGTAVAPALAALAMLRQRDGEPDPALAAVAEHVPADVRRSLQAGKLDAADAAAGARHQASYDKLVQLTGMLYRAGIPLLPGGGGLAGFSLQGELALYVKAGLSPAQALQLASWQAARHTGTLHERGSVSAGKLADLVLVDGDPTRDIGELRKVALVITRGKLIYPHEIDAALGIAPFVPAPPVLRPVVRGPVPGRP